MEQHLSREEAEEMVRLLAAEFGIRPPTLRWSFRATRGRACYLENWISCGPLCWRGAVNSMLHEFAHILTFRRNGPMHLHHGDAFQFNLLHVVSAWFGTDNISEYPWGSEYKRVAAFGKARLARKKV